MFLQILQMLIGSAYQHILKDSKRKPDDLSKSGSQVLVSSKNDTLLDSSEPSSPNQALGPVVTQEGMPLPSHRHVRESYSAHANK